MFGFAEAIVMIRNNLRVLEQKVNASDLLRWSYGCGEPEITQTKNEEPKLDAPSFHLCPSWTKSVQNRQLEIGNRKFRVILFKNKDDQFRTGA